MATAAPRILWKGAITFRLVHIPVALHAAARDHALNFDWLDRRSMDPVGYKRINKGQKVYVLLRETPRKAGRIGIARVVIQTREHLAALVPSGAVRVLNLLRWADEIRPVKDLPLPPEGAKAGKTHTVERIEPQDAAPTSNSAKILDLTERLQRSLRGGKAPRRKAA